MLFTKACSIHLHYAIHFTNKVRQSQALIESFWDKSSNWSKLTKHRTTERSEAVVVSLGETGIYVQTLFALMSEDTHTKKVSASVQMNRAG